MTTRPVIFLVDDNPTDRQLMVEAIQSAADVHVVVKASSDAAVNYLKWFDVGANDAPPFAMFVDVSMPGGSGFDVLVALHKHAQLHDVPVVMFTKSQDETDVYLSYELGANAYVVKPSSPERFRAAVVLATSFWLRSNHRPVHGVAVPH